MSYSSLGHYYQTLRDLKRYHHYQTGEVEGMYPFERDILIKMLVAEKLKDQDVPEQGWSQYAKEIGAAQKTRYSDKFRVVGEAGEQV